MDAKSDLLVAKIVSNPSQTAWAQAYNAGNLFAVLSLKREELGEELESESLSAIGKKVLDNLEQNFFTLEKKDLESIKQAVFTFSQAIPPGIESSFVVAAFSKNVLYLFANDKGKVFVKRNEKFGKILESNDPNPNVIVASSGFVQGNDLIILGTKTFFDIVGAETLTSSFDHKTPDEIAEILTPTIHEKEEGKAAAIIIQYAEKKEMETAFVEEQPQEEINPSESKPKLAFLASFLSNVRFSHAKKVFLTIAVVILLIFISSVFFALKKQNETKTKVLFNDIYPKAQKSYEEGISLVDLNKTLARDSFLTSQKILNEGKQKFAKNSSEEKQILSLLQKVNKGLEESSPEKIAQSSDRTKIIISIENGSGIEGVAGKASDFLKGKGYNVSSTGNADNYKYVGVRIKTKTSTNAYLTLLKKDLLEKYTITNSSSDLPEDSTADVLVIIGK